MSSTSYQAPDSQQTSTPNMQSRATVRVTKSTGTDYLSPTVDTLSAAFATDPIMHYFLNHAPSKPSETSLRHRLFNIIFTCASLSQGIFYESSTIPTPTTPTIPTPPSFHCAAIIMPPGRAADSPGFWGWLHISRLGLLPLIYSLGLRRFWRILFEYPSKCESFKRAIFTPSETYYYVLMIATDTRFRGLGLCSRVMEEVKGRAQREGKPVWLEATTEGSRDLYARLGWEDVVTGETEVGGGFRIGRGVCDGEGGEARGERAEGVRIWPMVWWPEGYVRGVVMKG